MQDIAHECNVDDGTAFCVTYDQISSCGTE